MSQWSFLFLIGGIQLARALILRIGKNNVSFLWLSFFVISIPFEINEAFGGDKYDKLTGTVVPIYNISVPLCICLLLVFKSKLAVLLTNKIKGWVTVLVLLIVISLINPFNTNIKATVAFALLVISHIALYKVFFSSIEFHQIIKGLYDGFFVICSCQIVLAVCFPLLGMVSVTNLFHSGAADAATRGGTRDGAIGFFVHPGALALFTIIASSFFMSCFLYNYKKTFSLMMLVINTGTILLTFSRTSYIGFVLILCFLVFIKLNFNKKIFSIGYLLRFLIPLFALIGWVIFLSPISSVFLKSDAGAQVINRQIHYNIAYKVFLASPAIGIGLNTEVSYVRGHPLIVSSIMGTGKNLAEFYIQNPVHNIHLIILCETGVLGFLLWVLFVVRGIVLSKNQLAINFNHILSLTYIGTLLGVSFYGMTGWSPLSAGLLPFFLMISFFAIKYRV